MQTGKKIIFIDDDQMIVDLAGDMLACLGYQTSCFRSASAALEFLATSLDDYDLLITDYTMQEMSGIEVIRRARCSGYNGAVAITTGFAAEDFEQSELDELKVSAFLHKPFQLKQLEKIIHEARQSALAVSPKPLAVGE